MSSTTPDPGPVPGADPGPGTAPGPGAATGAGAGTGSGTGSGTGHAPRGGGDGGSWASGGTMFAGVLMLVEGVFGVLGGIAAIAEDDVYTRIGDYVYKFNLTTWGWIHLILGVIVAFVGWGILQGAAWARGVGVGLAAVVMVAQFLWLPYQPLWALISIALALFVIWALCTDRGRTASV